MCIINGLGRIKALQESLIPPELGSEGLDPLLKTALLLPQLLHRLIYHGQHHHEILAENANGIVASSFKLGKDCRVTSQETRWNVMSSGPIPFSDLLMLAILHGFEQDRCRDTGFPLVSKAILT